jgi:ribosomal protein L32E
MKMPKCGYGSNKLTKHLLPTFHLKKFVVNNISELDLLFMNNDKYAAEIASTVGAFKRIQIVRKAKELGIKVTNVNSAKTKKTEDKKI